MIMTIGINALAARNADDSAERYSFREIYDVVNDPEWSSMAYPERLVACQIPEEQLAEMSTDELIQAVIEYPFFVLIHMFDTIEEGYLNVLVGCDALQELITRLDRSAAMINSYRKAKVVGSVNSEADSTAFSYLWNMELLISQKDFTAAMTDEQKTQLLSIAESKYEEKSKHTDIYGASIGAFYESYYGNNTRPSLEYVYTPNGSAVAVDRWNNGDDELTYEEKTKINNDTANSFPGAIRLSIIDRV